MSMRIDSGGAAPIVLLTGFEPFGAHGMNPSARIVEKLDGSSIRPFRLVGSILPVTASGAGPALEAAILRHHPRIVLSLGLAGGRWGTLGRARRHQYAGLSSSGQ